MSTPSSWRLELGTPGALRDRLVAAVLDGTKVASTLIRPQLPPLDDDLPRVGERYPLVDSAGMPAAEVQLDAIAEVAIGDIGMDHVRADSARFATMAQWREAHVAAWASLTGQDESAFDDGVRVFALRFHVI